MSDPDYTAESNHKGLKSAILIGAVVASLAANLFLYFQLDKVKTEMAKLRETTLTEITNLRETSSVTTQTNRRHLDTLKEQLEEARRQSHMAASQAKAEAVKRAEQLEKQIAAEQAAQQRTASELTEVKQSASAATAKIGEVSGEVTNVKSELGMTKAELEKTIAGLKKVTGDLDVTSGYVATNGKELAALKRLGERNYFEFNISKSKQRQRVGDVTLLLKRADPKRNKYTLEVLADDKTTEKRDKNINEPIQFYVAKAGRIPYEIVVNEVRKDQIIGYLATPKEAAPRN